MARQAVKRARHVTNQARRARPTAVPTIVDVEENFPSQPITGSLTTFLGCSLFLNLYFYPEGRNIFHFKNTPRVETFHFKKYPGVRNGKLESVTF